MYKSNLPFIGISVLFSVIGADAFAQNQEAEEMQPLPVAKLGTMFVTAQKRSEDATEVPISMDVMNSDDFNRLHLYTTEGVLSYSPNAQMGRGNSGAAYTPYIAIRGVGSAEIDSDPSVGMFVDGIPVTDTQSYTSNMLDMERVEILRGPQGTLYGRNTLGGSINLVTRRPNLDEREGLLAFDIGNYGYVRTELVNNLPFDQGNSAIRAAIAFDRNSGFVDNYAPGQKDDQASENYQGRFSFLKKFGSVTTLEFSIEGQKQRRRDGAVMTISEYNRGTDHVTMNNAFHGELKSAGARIEVNHIFNDGHVFTSLTGFREQDTDYEGRAAPDGYFASTEDYMQSMGLWGYKRRVNNSFSGDFKQYSQEFRLSSPDETSFKYVIGIYADYSKRNRNYNAEDSWNVNNIMFPGTSGVNVEMASKTDSWSLAAFADGSYAFNEKWEIFGGLRIGHDVKKFDYKMKSNNSDYVQMMLTSPSDEQVVTNYSRNLSKNYVTPRVGLRRKINEDHNVYMSVSRGYKSGGFNTSILYPSISGEYKEETLTNYEIGMKNTFFNRRITLDSALFYIDWKNQQVLSYDTLTNATPILNANKSRSAGIELALKANVGQGWSIGAGIGYADAIYRDFRGAPRTGRPGQVNVKGKQQQYHSKFTGNVEIGYEWGLGWHDLQGIVNIGYQYRSKFYFDPENILSQKGYGTFNARLGVSSDKYGVFLWGRNLASKRALASAAHLNGDGALVTEIAPRTFGLNGFIKF